MILPRNTVHLWAVPLTAAPDRLAELRAILTPTERERAARYVAATKREEFIVARASLRLLLGRYLGIAPNNVQFTTGDTGKPSLAGREFFFNISHTHGLAVHAFTHLGEVGVDVEQVKTYPSYADLAARYFTPVEAAAVADEEQFFAVWTRKEAFLKATALGISHGLERFAVSVPPDDPPRIVHIDGDERAAEEWSLQSLEPAPGYVAALALRGPTPRIELSAWGEGR